MSFRSGFVTLLGRPNTGKSTLLNRLVGAKVAIVSPHPQTTRTRLQGVLTRDHAQVVFVDTPGIHRPRSRLNEQMMKSVREGLAGVDLVALMIDASRPTNDEDEMALELAGRFSGPSFLLLNKIDLIEKQALLPLMDRLRRQHAFREIIPLSALTGENCDLLEKKIIENLPEGPSYFPADTLTDQPVRFLAAEIVREQVFCQTRDEVPYSTAVVVEKFEEPEVAAGSSPARPLTRIYAAILVDREGQKGILIGAGGQRLKKIGEAARKKLEDLLETRVYLELFVKTRADWRQQTDVEHLIDWRHD